MTDSATAAPPAAQTNGTGPAEAGMQPAAAADAELTPVSERVMGIIGILFAVGLLAIGVDLALGGALSRVIFGDGTEDADGRA